MNESAKYGRALVIDDDKVWRATAVTVLSLMKFEVDDVENVEQAEFMIEQQQYQLILSDLRLVDSDPSDISGLKLLAMAKEKNQSSKVVLITAHHDALVRSRAVKGFAPDALLYKEINGDFLSLGDMRDKIQKVIDRQD